MPFVRKSIFSLSLFLCPLLAGCSYFEKEEVPDTGLSTTGVGAAAGAVMGAGLGAIIGSATGDAGGGLAIGTVAGAATGAVVGAQIEKQQNETEVQKEELARQKEEVESTRRQMEEMRRNQSQDVVSREPSRAMMNTSEKVPAGYQSLDGRRPQPYGSATVARKAKVDHSAEQAASVRVVEKTPAAVVVKPTEPAQASIGALPPASAKVSKTAETEEVDLLSAEAPPEVVSKIEDTEVEASADDPGCKDAEAEAKRGRASNSDADKLFYLRRAIRLCAKNAAYHLEIGKIYKSIGRTEDAAYEFRQVLDLEPGNDEAQKLLSSVEGSTELSKNDGPAGE